MQNKSFELRHLRYFLTVAEELHFGRAARRLGISQPPLSQQIAALETSLGVALFVRTSRMVQLTQAGKALVGHARDVLALVERLPVAVQGAARGETGRLVLGFSATSEVGLLPPLIRAFRAEHPCVELVIREGSVELLTADVVNGIADVAIVRSAPSGSALASCVIRRAPLVLAVPSDHALSGRASVEWNELADVDFVLFPRVNAPGLYDLIIARCRRAGFSPRVAQEASDWPVVSALVAGGVGVAIAPQGAQAVLVPGVTYVSFEGESADAELVAVWRSNDPSVLISDLLTLFRRVAGGEPDR